MVSSAPKGIKNLLGSTPAQRNQVILYAVAGCAVLTLIIVLFLVFDVSRNQSSGQGSVRSLSLPPSDSVNIKLPNEDSSVEGVVKSVSRHMLLPEGNVTVATVVDPNVLRAQNPIVFQYVKKGDKIIQYSHGFIIYDPQLDRIVDVLRLLPTINRQGQPAPPPVGVSGGR